MSEPIRAVIGLGNPGAQYAATRHNAGHWFVDAVARSLAVSFKFDKRLNGELATCGVGSDRVFLFKPATFMNVAGGPCRALTDYYRLSVPTLLVAYDELDLEPGVARLKVGGGHGGHNGLRDIFAHLPSADFVRLRIGIGHPGHKDRVSRYVLSRPSRDDEAAIGEAIERGLDVIHRVLEGRIESAMNELHRAV